MKCSNDKQPREWINPTGGLGDTLMLTGVLKQVIERDPERRFNLVRRTAYSGLLGDHPAIETIGFPGKGDTILGADYWSHETFDDRRSRPMQVLGRMFGLDRVEERFHVTLDDRDDLLLETIPWQDVNIVVSPASASPRKEWSHANWESLVGRLRARGWFVVQVGRARERHVRGAYSTLGLTSPKQAIALMRRAAVVVTVDSFIMHAAHHLLKPSVVLWGPTSKDVYGYPEQTHICPPDGCRAGCDCIGPGKGEIYSTPCPRVDAHCVDRIEVDHVLAAIEQLVG